jgi:hemerythrin-like domain-containing protein
MKATDVLRSEHEVILDVLAALEAMIRPAALAEGLDLRSAEEALEFLRCFADRCHHGKEEQHLFPAMAARGLPREVGPLAVMAAEHDQGRALLARMAVGLAEAKQGEPAGQARFGAATAAYVELMRDHIEKENGVLFPMGDGMLAEAQQTELLRAFERFEHADMEEGAHARFLDVASGLCQRLGVERTPQVGAASHRCCGHGSRCS